MDTEIKESIRKILNNFAGMDYIRPQDVPDIALYMDQVTTFMEERLKSCRRHDDDKIMTKTMINNYAKNGLIPPPDRKKYSKEHLLIFIFIYYFKSFLSISDIETLITPLTETYFNSGEDFNVEKVYRLIYDMIHGQLGYMAKDLIRRYELSNLDFEGCDEEDKAYLHDFAFICLLSFDVYVKKQMIEKLIDDMPDPKTVRHKADSRRKDPETSR